MSRTFLSLCQDVVADLGIAGGTLSSTQAATNQEIVRICNWVARADLYLQNLWTQWNFLWYLDANVQAASGSDQCNISLPVWAQNVQTYDLQSLWINAGRSNAQNLKWMPWDQFYRIYQVKPKSTQSVPAFFSVDPSGQIWLSSYTTGLTIFSMAYYVIGKRLTNDTDTSPIPTNFDTIICERAKIIYAGRENAPEILTSANAEYSDQLDKMQGYCLPENLAGRTLRNNITTSPAAYVE